MKAKDYILCGLVAAILAVCCFTSFIVIKEQKKQTKYLESVQFFAGEMTQAVTAKNAEEEGAVDYGYFFTVTSDTFYETIAKFRELYPELMQKRIQ